jgi:hypothetical protein
MGSINTLSLHASAFLRDDAAALVAHGVTEEQVWRDNLSKDERSIQVEHRKAQYGQFLDRAQRRTWDFIGNGALLEPLVDFQKELMTLVATFVTISNDLTQHGSNPSSPPVSTNMMKNLLNRFLTYQPRLHDGYIPEEEYVLIGWLDSQPEQMLPQFVDVDVLQILATAVPAIWTGGSTTEFSSNSPVLDAAVFILDAVLRASLRQEGTTPAKIYITNEENLQGICQVLFKTLTLQDHFGPSTDELSMTVYWPRALFGLARDTSVSANQAWKSAIQAVIQATPLVIHESRLTKDHFSLVEDLKRVCNLDDHDDPMLKQWIHLPLEDVEKVE